MSRNGSGGYNLPTNSWNPAVNGVSATPADWQNLINDVATAIQQSVSADGQTPITGNINMNNNKFTGLAAGNATGNSLRWEQLFSQGVEQDIASAATTDIGLQNSNFLRITGTTTITSFGANYNGPRFIRFQGAVTLSNSPSLQLPYSGDFISAADDCIIVIPKATAGTSDGWKVVSVLRATTVAERASIGASNNPFRNRVINGDFQMRQRDDDLNNNSVVNGAALKYKLYDRFYSFCTGANTTIEDGSLGNNEFSLRLNGAASLASLGIGTRLPSNSVLDLNNGSATLSCRLQTSGVAVDVTWAVYHANTQDTFGTLASPNRTLIATGVFNAGASESQFAATMSMPSGTIQGVEIVFTTAAMNGEVYVDIGKIQLEKGSISAQNIVFETVDKQLQQLRCDYFYKRFDTFGALAIFGSGHQNSTTVSRITLPIGKMRRIPTVSFAGTVLLDIAGTSTAATLSTQYNSLNSVAFDVTHAAVGAAGGAAMLQLPSSVSNYIEIDAEMYT